MNWKVALSDIDMDDAELAAVVGVLESRWLSMGQVTQEFERQFADYLGVKHAFAVANCTSALHLAYAALGLGPGDEVVLPSLSFVATANAALYTGARPVFADVTSLDDLNICPDEVERRITSRTRAIAVMHYGGHLCAMDRIVDLAQRYDLALVEDAAHAPGATIHGQRAGTIGDVGCFSFFSNKNLVTGEGGMIVTNRDDVADRIKLMRSHGMTTLTWERHGGHAHSYDVVAVGYNYRIDEIRSALGLVQLGKLERNNGRRRELADLYREKLTGFPEVHIPFGDHPGTSACHIFPILLDETISRRAFIEAMRDEGIQTSVHYPPIHLFSYYRERFGYGEGILPVTEAVGKREVTLPLFPTMGPELVELVARGVEIALERRIEVTR